MESELQEMKREWDEAIGRDPELQKLVEELEKILGSKGVEVAMIAFSEGYKLGQEKANHFFAQQVAHHIVQQFSEPEATDGRQD